MTAWAASLASTLGKRTVREYLIYARAHWLTRWTTLGDVTTAAIGDYQRERLAKVTRVTLRKELSALRGLLEWCRERGALHELPEVPRLPRQATGTRSAALPLERVVLRAGEAQRLIRALPAGRTREYVAFAYETGLRPATIFRLCTPEHWAPGRCTLRITPDVDKARFARELPLTAAARAVLERVEPTIRGALFARRDLVLEELHETSERVLGRRVGLYDLRHSRITLLVEAGGPLAGVQYLAGHASIATTARYIQANRDAARVVLRTRSKSAAPARR